MIWAVTIAVSITASAMPCLLQVLIPDSEDPQHIYVVVDISFGDFKMKLDGKSWGTSLNEPLATSTQLVQGLNLQRFKGLHYMPGISAAQVHLTEGFRHIALKVSALLHQGINVQA